MDANIVYAYNFIRERKMYTKKQINRIMGGFFSNKNVEIKTDKKGCYDLIGPKVIST